MKKTKAQTSGKGPADLGSQEAGVIPPLTSGNSTDEQVRQEIRSELVKKFKSSLQKGNYKVKAPEIAEKIVQKIRENKNGL